VQCSTNADCLARGAGFAGAVCADHVCVAASAPPGPSADAGTATDATPSNADAGPWGCLDSPPQAADPSAIVDVELHVVDALKPLTTGGSAGTSDLTIVAGTPFPNVTVQACNVLDPECAQPIAPAVTTNADGVAHLTLSGNFSGFYSLKRSDLLPTTLYPGALLADASVAPTPAPLLAQSGVALLASSIGVTFESGPDAGVGHLFINAFDCADRHAPGVMFAISAHGPKTTTFYTKGGLPSTTVDQTDTLGAGGAVNVPIGLATVTATLASSGRTIGSSNVVIREGEATFAWLRPRVH
jgi:hypothetical protein